MFTRSMARVGALACVAALALGACGSSDKKSADPASATTVQTGDAASTTNTTVKAGDSNSSATTDACAFITEAQAQEFIGAPVTKSTPTAPPQTTSCMYEATPEAGSTYSIQTQLSDSDAFYAGSQSGYTPVSGIGDKAAVRVGPTGAEVFVSFVDGGKAGNILYSAHKIGAKSLAAPKKDALIALVEKAVNG